MKVNLVSRILFISSSTHQRENPDLTDLIYGGRVAWSLEDPTCLKDAWIGRP